MNLQEKITYHVEQAQANSDIFGASMTTFRIIAAMREALTSDEAADAAWRQQRRERTHHTPRQKARAAINAALDAVTERGEG